MLESSRIQSPRNRFRRAVTQAKKYETESEQYNYFSPQNKNISRFRLVPITNTPKQIKYQYKKTNSIYQDSLQRQTKFVRADIGKISKQIRLKNANKRQQTAGNSIKFDSHILTNRLKEKLRIQTEPQRYINSYEKDQYSPIWENKQTSLYHNNQKKKLYKIKSRKNKRNTIAISNYYQRTDNFPMIDKITFGSSKRGQKRYHASFISQQPLRHNRTRAYSTFRKFRKIAHAILFTIYLRTFNERMRQNRKIMFNKYVKQQLKDRLIQMKRFFVQGSKPFFQTIIDQYNFDYRLSNKDDHSLRRKKVESLRKLAELQIQCIEKCIKSMNNRNYLTETLYHLCKHGNYSDLYDINTNEQLNLSCISDCYGYVRSDKYLQQSSLLSLILIKILLFNILLQPQTINMHINFDHDTILVNNNIRLVGNIIYQMLIDIQDQLIQASPSLYKIGNWGQLKNRFKFRLSQSMTIKQGIYQKNELISGLLPHKYIKQTFGTKGMINSKFLFQNSIKLLHENIARHHKKICKKIFQT